MFNPECHLSKNKQYRFPAFHKNIMASRHSNYTGVLLIDLIFGADSNFAEYISLSTSHPLPFPDPTRPSKCPKGPRNAMFSLFTHPMNLRFPLFKHPMNLPISSTAHPTTHPRTPSANSEKPISANIADHRNRPKQFVNFAQKQPTSTNNNRHQTTKKRQT